MKDSNFSEEFDFTEELELSDVLSPEEIALDEELLEAVLETELLSEDPALEEIPAGIYPAEEIFDAVDNLEEATSDNIVCEELELPETSEELVAADHAMYTAGLHHPEDEEFRFEEEIIESDDLTPEEEPEEVPEAPVKPASQQKERPSRKGRPKRKKGAGMFGIPHLLAAIIWLLIIVAIGTTLGRMLWVCAADVLAFGREDKDVVISVTTDDTMESIAQKLQRAGLVRYPELFLIYADLTDAEEDITTGTFTLNTVYDYHALVSQMSPRSGVRSVVEDVLIPEGYNCRQIFALLEEKGICKAADLEAWAASGELSEYWFLDGVERGHKYCLEGFLFPDTYDFYENSTPRAALEKMLDGFEYRVGEEMRAKIPVLNEHLTAMMQKNGDSAEFIAANQFDIRDVINVASLIEKETASNQESYTIASVIYNRLFNWGTTPRYLNIDATIIYALGGKSDLTSEDMAVDSPYNTYTNVGMTPGPIANPGLASIEAALDPESTSYYYYVLDPAKGAHQFSTTLAEHEKKIKQIYGD